MLVVGMAYQMGMIPVRATAIEEAIRLNGVAVEMNASAFTLGRRIVADPDLLTELSASATVVEPSAPTPTRVVQALLGTVPDPGADLDEILRWRIPELIAWGDEEYARRYTSTIAAVRSSEQESGVFGTPLSSVAARHLFKLMAYKDEYEVARLALRGDMEAQAKSRFGPNATLSYELHPPSLKKVGVKKKISIPSSVAQKTFASLLKSKKVRGTRLDPFGRSEERRVERELIIEYEQLLVRLRSELRPDNVETLASIADLADQIRGFDEIKLGNVARYREQVAAALTALG